MELKDLANYGSFGAAVPGMSRSLKKEADKYQNEEEKRRMEEQAAAEQAAAEGGMKKGGRVKGGKVKMSTASKRADGIAQRGKTKGRMV
jgi:hypothetical protein